MERIRAFIALTLPVGSTEAVVALQRTLRECAQTEGVRVAWVPPPNLHLTLKFLGDIPAESAHAVRDQLRAHLERRQAWPLRLQAVSVFPDESKPRVVWVGVDDGGQTTALAQDIETWMDELGFAREKRPYHAHLTLGLVKQGGAPFWRGSAEFSADTCLPSEVVLYQSQLERQGAEYRALERYALRQPEKSPTTNPSEEIANHGSKPQ